jgi:16S rRNA (guanine527-N7)-methyltransferase
MPSDLISSYFPELTSKQIEQFSKLQALYVHWNEQINVISRKDTKNFYERHVLHSLGIAKVIQFKKGTKIMDVGTGGGFPGIPLAILFPDCEFLLVDSIGKKIKVVNEVANALGLKNVTGKHERAEKVEGTFDFIVSRSVTQMPEFISWVKNKISKTSKNSLPNGILYLKGGDLSEEMKTVKQWFKEYNLKDFFEGEFFQTKKVVYLKF